MTIDAMNKEYGDALEMVNDLHEMRLDHPHLREDVNFLKRYSDAMDKVFSIHMQIIEHYQLQEYASKK